MSVSVSIWVRVPWSLSRSRSKSKSKAAISEVPKPAAPNKRLHRRRSPVFKVSLLSKGFCAQSMWMMRLCLPGEHSGHPGGTRAGGGVGVGGRGARGVEFGEAAAGEGRQAAPQQPLHHPPSSQGLPRPQDPGPGGARDRHLRPLPPLRQRLPFQGRVPVTRPSSLPSPPFNSQVFGAGATRNSTKPAPSSAPPSAPLPSTAAPRSRRRFLGEGSRNPRKISSLQPYVSPDSNGIWNATKASKTSRSI